MADPFYDAVVAGGGPAGLLVASRVRGASLVVAVRGGPGWPPHCTGIVSPATAERIGFREAVSEAYECAVFMDWRGRELCSVCGSPLAVRLERPLLEELMLSEVLGRGHRVAVGRGLVAWRLVDGGVRALVDGVGWVRARVLVLATGAAAAPRRCRRAVGLEVRARLVSRAPEEVFETYHLVPGAGRMFGWLVPVNGGREALVGVMAEPAGLGAAFEAVLRIVERRYGVASMASRRAGVLVLGPPVRELVSGPVVRLGDAACASKPFTGGGLYAISLLAPVAAEALERGLEPLSRAWQGVRAELLTQYTLVGLYEALAAASRRLALTALRAVACGCTPGFDEHSRALGCLLPRRAG